MTEYKCVGEEDMADKIIVEAISELSMKEKYYERNYDHFLYSRTMKRFVKDKELLDNISTDFY